MTPANRFALEQTRYLTSTTGFSQKRSCLWIPKTAISPEQTCLKQENMRFAPSAKTLKHNSLPLNSGQTSITPQLPLIAPNPLSKNGEDTVLSPRPVGTASTPSVIRRKTRRVFWQMLRRESMADLGRDGFHAVPDQTSRPPEDHTGTNGKC